MTSLGVGLWRGRNGLKGEIKEVMSEGIYDNGLDLGEGVTS